MKIGIPKEIMKGETRVSVIPSMIAILKKENDVFIESGAGLKASFSDDQYRESGAEIVSNAVELYSEVDLVIKFQAPQENRAVGKHEIELLKDGALLISSLPPAIHDQVMNRFLEKKITSFAMDYIPRITKAQSMDVLSSMSTIAGYKAVLVAAHHLGKIFPLLMTAAGTIPSVTAFVLGAGVAGLQAIATAKRLGAKVEAFDPRPAVREQVESVGGHFIKMALPEEVETAGGYAKEQSETFLKNEREAIAARFPKVDVVITTAQVFGKPSPLLITEDMVQLLKPGSVIVDLAVAEGGNCSLSKENEVVEKYGVTVFGVANIARTVPVHASQMHSKNVTNLFKHLFKDGNSAIDLNDEITRGACITHNGEIINERVRTVFKKES